MSITRLAIRGVAFNWIGKVCAIAITFVLTPILIHGLGNESYGIWSLVLSMSAYYSLANLGFRAAGVKYISQFDAIDDHQSVNKVVVTMLAAYLPIAGFVLLLAAVIAWVFPMVVEISQASSTVQLVVIVTGAAICVGIVGQVFEATLVALKRFDQINMLAVVAQVTQAVLLVTAIRMGGRLLSMAWIILALAIVRQLCTIVLALRAAGYPRLSVQFFDWSTLRTLFQFGSLNVGVEFARRLINFGGSVIIGVILGPIMVAFYAVAQSLASKTEDIGKGVNSVLMPVVSQLDAQNRPHELADTFLLASRTLIATTLGIATVFICMGRPLITFWIDPEYAQRSYPVLCLLALAMTIRVPGTCAANVLKGTGRMGRLAKIAIFEALLTVTLGAVLVYFFGIMGMGWALLSVTAISGTILPIVTCRSIEIPILLYARKSWLPGAVAALPGVVVALALYSLAPPSHLLHVVLQAIGILAVTGVTMFFVCLDEESRSSLLQIFSQDELRTRESRSKVVAERTV